MSSVVRCQRRYNYKMTDPRKILFCSLCIILASSVEEGNKVSGTVQVSKENEGDIQGYPSKKIIPCQSLWDINHLNDRMLGITYIWHSQAPVSINSCLTEAVKRFPVAFFFEQLSWTEEIHANWRRKETFLSCINGQIYFSFPSFET